MKPVIVIPARGGSKGIHKKNLINFCGLPLIAWSIKQGLNTTLPVFVSTEDEDIKRCSLEFNAIVIDRPPDLATDTSGTIDALRHAAKWLVERKEEFDHIVLLQPTSPLRLNCDILHFLKRAAIDKKRYGFCCTRETYIEWPDGYSIFPAGTAPRRQDLDAKTIEHGMVYFYSEDYYPLGFGSLTREDILMYETEPWQRFEIDTCDDIELCEFYMRKKVLCSNAD